MLPITDPAAAVPLMRRAEGGGGNKAPHASSKSAAGKAGRLEEP